MYQKVREGVYFHQAYGRIMEHRGYSTRIFWNRQMLDYLKSNFATMLNEELAACLGVSMRTLIRKARELCLTKDPAWLKAIYEERRLIAQHVNRTKGNPGFFKKGIHSEYEFKPGRVPTEEQKRKQSESMKRWYLRHPVEARAKAKKAWETRRKKAEL